MLTVESQTKWVDLFGNIVQRVSAAKEATLIAADSTITGVHYMYGHYNEIKLKLAERAAGGDTYKYTRYPLICIFQDFPVQKGTIGIKGRATLQAMILYHTTAERYIEDRYEQVFTPILYPLYDELLNQIVLSGYFLETCTDHISHEQIDRPHWGDPGIHGNNGYIFGDCLDGIELRNLVLSAY